MTFKLYIVPSSRDLYRIPLDQGNTTAYNPRASLYHGQIITKIALAKVAPPMEQTLV